MRKLKLIVLIIAILLVQGLAFGDEIVEKEGNTIKIKLVEEASNEFDKLLGETAVTETSNFIIKRKKHVYGTGMHHNSLNTNDVLVGFYDNDNVFFTIEDKEQNGADFEIVKLDLTSDDTYYYFDYEIKYNAPNVTFNTALSVGDNYQKINTGTLYLSDKPYTSINYRYTSKLDNESSELMSDDVSGTIYNIYAYRGWDRWDSLYINKDRTDNLKLTLNDLTCEQEMKFNGTNNYVPDNKDIISQNNTSLYYCTLKFPFEEWIAGTNKKTEFTLTPNSYLYSDCSSKFSKIVSSIQNQILFTNGQVNYIYPKKITEYEPIEQTITKDDLSLTWNNDFRGTIKIKKDELEHYRYLNMYCPNAVYTKEQKGMYQNRNNYNNCLLLNEMEYQAKSVHSSSAIDLMDYLCHHEFEPIKIDNLTSHELKCKLCGVKSEENHNFKFEYDGIPNNLCECGFCYRIHNKYEYNSQDTVDIDNIVVATSSYTKPNNPIKTGYLFDGYKQYIKTFADETNPVFDINNTELKEVYDKDIVSLPDKSNYYSARYEAKYLPIKYKIIFSNENNKNLNINHGINDLICEYDIEYDTPQVSGNGYVFTGWTISTYSNVILASSNIKITNLTAVNNNEIILYPFFTDKPQKNNTNTNKNITAGGVSSSGGSSGGVNSENITSNSLKNNSVEKIELIKQTVKTSSSQQKRNINNVKISKAIISIISFIKEIFNDYIEQNNIDNENSTTISSFMGKIYNDFKRNNNINE